jgi:glycosyltransferase involved in cell wall biosynthesis
VGIEVASTGENINRFSISVVIPTYRNETHIKNCIESSLSFFRENNKIEQFEIIFASDRAGDRTIEIIKKYLADNSEIILMENKTRLQKGGSIKRAMLKTRYPIKLYYDVDLSTPLEEVDRFLECIDRCDIVIGSRRIKGANVKKSSFKKFLSSGFSLLNYVVLGLTYRDTQCGFKMFKENCLDIFRKQRIKSNAFDVEILWLAKKTGFRVKELPVTWIDTDTSNFTVLGAVRSLLKGTIQVRFNAWKKRYEDE